jgi:hypothetical protein
VACLSCGSEDQCQALEVYHVGWPGRSACRKQAASCHQQVCKVTCTDQFCPCCECMARVMHVCFRPALAVACFHCIVWASSDVSTVPESLIPRCCIFVACGNWRALSIPYCLVLGPGRLPSCSMHCSHRVAWHAPHVFGVEDCAAPSTCVYMACLSLLELPTRSD